MSNWLWPRPQRPTIVIRLTCISFSPPLESSARASCRIIRGRSESSKGGSPPTRNILSDYPHQAKLSLRTETRLSLPHLPRAASSTTLPCWLVKLSQVAIVSLRGVSGVTVALAACLLMCKVCCFIRLYVFMARACAPIRSRWKIATYRACLLGLVIKSWSLGKNRLEICCRRTGIEIWESF